MPHTVLVVDDEPDVVTYLCALLRDNGYETLQAFDGAQALEMVRAHHPSLVTLDISMPDSSGVKTYRLLKEDEDLRSIPVVIVTGIAREFKRFISTRRQVPPPDGYLEKPIQPEDLLEQVRQLIGRRADDPDPV